MSNLQESDNANAQSATTAVLTSTPRFSHRSSRLVTLDEMEAIPAPEGTDTWRPVQHRQVVDAIHAAATSKGLSITQEEYSITPNDRQMFGVIKLEKGDSPEWTRCIGVRNGNDKVMALGIAVGIAVFVCDNRAFAGEQVFHRRHTARFEIDEVVESAFDGIDSRFSSFESRLLTLKGERVSRDEAAGVITRIAELGGIRSIDILPILQEFEHPRHEEFAAPTRWSLLNAFTEIAKLYRPRRYHDFQNVLASAFNLDNQ